MWGRNLCKGSSWVEEDYDGGDDGKVAKEGGSWELPNVLIDSIGRMNNERNFRHPTWRIHGLFLQRISGIT